MKRRIIITFFVTVLILLMCSTAVSAKPIQSTFMPLGQGLDGNIVAYDYNSVPLLEWAWGLEVYKHPGNVKFTDSKPLPQVNASRIHFSQYAAHALDLVDGDVVGSITVYYTDSTSSSIDLVMGINTAEWSYDHPTQPAPSHAKIPPSFSYLVTDDPDPSVPDYLGHHFYTYIDTDSSKTLDYIQLELGNFPGRPHLGAGITAITIETPGSPPHIAGSGWVEGSSGEKCHFSISVKTNKSSPWPKGTFMYRDSTTSMNVKCDTFLKSGPAFNDPDWDAVVQGWCSINGIPGSYFVLKVKDGGNPGISGDMLYLYIWNEGGVVINVDGQPLCKGNIVIKY